MKQIQFAYRDEQSLAAELARVKRYCDRLAAGQAVFEIYTKEKDESRVMAITDVIEEQMPEAYYLGCLTNGNILNGEFVDVDTVVACIVFEYDTTRIETVQISCSDDDYEDRLARLVESCNAGEWVKCIGMLTTVEMLSAGFLDYMTERLDPRLLCLGGCSADPDDPLFNTDSYVFSKGRGISHDSTVFFIIGGDDLHVGSAYVMGYEPMGMAYKATGVENAVFLHTLNGEPAMDVYRRYLKIENNEHFFQNALGFPLVMHANGIDYLRVPVTVTADDSLVMSGEIIPGSTIRLSYGNQTNILRNIDRAAGEFAKMAPQVIRVYTCFTRKMYWGNENVGKETENFDTIAPTVGFFTRGEILRMNGEISALNATIVLTGLREGPAFPVKYHSMFESSDDSGMLSYEERLINFIGEATRELEGVNRELALSAIMDSFTKLYNREEIQKRVSRAVAAAHESGEPMALIMMDLDNFKRVNDTYGHGEGDSVIRGLSSILSGLDAQDERYSAGRWGGEEFMLLAERCSEEDAYALAEKIRGDFSDLIFPKAGRQSVSLGYTMMRENDTMDSICVRVDKALYRAKGSGKNRVERL